MNKPQLLEVLIKRTGCSKKEASKFLEAFVEIISESLKKGEKVNLSGFGVFDVSYRKKREGIDPRRKKRIIIPPLKTPHFRAGKNLKKALR